MRSVFFLLVPLALLLAACGGSGGQGGAAVPLPGQSAANAQATLVMVDAALQATAAVQAQQTAAAAQATAAQQAVLQATAGAATAAAATATTAAQTTADALTVRQTEIAIQMVVDAATAAASATHAWATPTAAARQTADALAAVNVAMVQADTATRMARQQRREETRATFQPILYGVGVAALAALILAAVGFLAFLIWRAIHLQRNPVVFVGERQYVQQSRGMLTPPEVRVIAAPRAALPAPRPMLETGPVAPLPDAQPIPLPRLVNTHALIAGPTGAGKSNAARALLAQRQHVTVLDPHSSGDDWGGAPVVGGGRNWNAIGEFGEWMRAELGRRYQERNAGRRQFDARTVALDEMPAIVDALGRNIEAVWREWLREGRKVGLFLVVMTQSTRVKTLGIQGEGDVLDNFGAVLIMGDAALAEYGPLVEGMRFPAVLRTAGRARPVIIPHMPESGAATIPAGDLDGNGQADAILMGPPLFTAPLPAVEHKADPRNLRPEDVDKIRRLLAANWSQSAVETEMFGYRGGAAWRVVQAVRNGESLQHLDLGRYSLSRLQ